MTPEATHTPTPEPGLPELDAVAARRWRERPRERSPWLHEEVARRMAERLPWIKREPQAWLHWAPMNGGLEGHQRVAALYPKAQVLVAGEGARGAARAIDREAGQAWNPFRRRPLAIDGPLPGAQADMVWANMALHLHSHPKALLRGWQGALRVDGFLMFACLGPDSLLGLRTVYAALGWPAPHHPYTDMHDWGDLLIEAGFAEPVMDMERLQLSYTDIDRLLADLRDWGRNLHAGRHPACRGRGWHRRLRQALAEHLPRGPGGEWLLGFEIVYGHAFKAPPRPRLGPETRVDMDDMREMLRRQRG